MKIGYFKHMLLLAAFACLVLSGCTQKETETVSITSETGKYSPAMSSIQGITLAAKITSSQKENYKYHWSTNSGSFITVTNNLDNPSTSIVTESEKVLWTPEFRDLEQSEYEVTVEIKDEKGAVLAKDTIEFIKDKDLFFIPKE